MRVDSLAEWSQPCASLQEAFPVDPGPQLTLVRVLEAHQRLRERREEHRDRLAVLLKGRPVEVKVHLKAR